jgi:hypothetical protein
MKRISALILLTFFNLSFSYAAGLVANPVIETSLVSINGKPQMDLKFFFSLTPRKIEQMTGKRMKLKERITLKITQYLLKREMKRNKAIDINDRKGMLRLFLIFLAIAVLASILASFVPFIWVIASIAGLAALIFFILWILAEAR